MAMERDRATPWPSAPGRGFPPRSVTLIARSRPRSCVISNSTVWPTFGAGAVGPIKKDSGVGMVGLVRLGGQGNVLVWLVQKGGHA